MAKAVVSTTIGAEGLPISPGQDILIADEPAAFANAVVRLIRDTAARREIETAARRLVVERYDWSAVAQDFEDALGRVALTREAGTLPDSAHPPEKGDSPLFADTYRNGDSPLARVS